MHQVKHPDIVSEAISVIFSVRGLKGPPTLAPFAPSLLMQKPDSLKGLLNTQELQNAIAKPQDRSDSICDEYRSIPSISPKPDGPGRSYCVDMQIVSLLENSSYDKAVVAAGTAQTLRIDALSTLICGSRSGG